jgi:hypothetical protein
VELHRSPTRSCNRQKKRHIGGSFGSLIFEGWGAGLWGDDNYFSSLGVGLDDCWSNKIPQKTVFFSLGIEIGRPLEMLWQPQLPKLSKLNKASSSLISVMPDYSFQSSSPNIGGCLVIERLGIGRIFLNASMRPIAHHHSHATAGHRTSGDCGLKIWAFRVLSWIFSNRIGS